MTVKPAALAMRACRRSNVQNSVARFSISNATCTVSSERHRVPIPCAAEKAHDEAQAERITKAGLAAMKMPVAVSELTGRVKWSLEKGAITAVIRERTGVSNR